MPIYNIRRGDQDGCPQHTGLAMATTSLMLVAAGRPFVAADGRFLVF